MAEKQPWDGIDRRKANAPLGVTALNIASRGANDGTTDVDVIFTDTGEAANNMVRGLDFDNNPLKSRVGAVLDASKAERQLTPEQKEITLQTLAARFAANEKLHKGVEWTKVKASLEAKPESLWSINEMEKAGHGPDVYNADNNGFDIGTCSKESPESGRNCVFDEAAEGWMKTNRPNERFNGNAVAMAEAMGINLMDPDLYKNVLQKKGRFDEQTWSWLLTQLDIRSTGFALIGNRSGVSVYVRQYLAHIHYDSGSWRGSLRVEWAA